MVNLKRTREDILDSVMGLIHHKGFQATGLKELFSVSGTSSGSFYNYFPSKLDLAHALIDYKWGQLKTVVIDPAKEKDDPISGLFEMISRLEEKHLAEPNCAGCLLGNLIVELVEQDATFREHLAQIFDEWQAEIASFLKRGRDQLKAGFTPEDLSENLLTQIEGVLLINRLYTQPERLKRGFSNIRFTLKNAIH
jgi:TetR/AcrR family transcriptional regulator, transcriptional repressor for nem operon